MITEADKLRFEIGEGFKNLSPDEICRNKALYRDISAVKIVEYGYNGDGPYYAAIEEFAKCLLELYCNNEEDFIQAVGEHHDWSMFGWAISKVSIDIREYAKVYFSNLILEKNNLISEEDPDLIGSILNDPTLPS
jgi:hypothetical protein